MTTEEYYSVREVAKLFKVTPQTVRIWIQNRELKAFKMGRSYRIPQSEVKAFIQGKIDG